MEASSESGAAAENQDKVQQEDDAAAAVNNSTVQVAGDDTASSSSHGEDEDEEDSDEDSDNDEDDDSQDHEQLPMPFLSYTRMFGSLPRRSRPATDGGSSSRPSPSSSSSAGPFAVPSTCSVMGQINLAHHQEPSGNGPEVATSSTDAMMQLRTPESVSTTGRRQLSTASSSSTTTDPYTYYDPLLVQQPHYVLAMGYCNGTVDLVDARTGVTAIPQPLRLRESANHPEESVVDMSMDSTGSYLAAVDTGRLVVIWEFRYTVALGYPSNYSNSATTTTASSSSLPQTPVAQQQQQYQQPAADESLFSGFMSALTLGGGSSHQQQSNPSAAPPPQQQQLTPSTPSPPRTTTTTTATTPEIGGGNNNSSSSSRVPRLATSRIEMSRITFPKSFGQPTCIAIDPSYSKKEKAILIGFVNGRVVMTKRGGIFQRRNDIIIHQSTYHNNDNNSSSSNNRGIEAIEWRGNICAWADATGIRIYDTESSVKVAAIDRPTGARPSLYPTLSSLRPTLRFETSDYLLVAWGDCLMGLSISEHGRPSVTSEDMQHQPAQQHQPPPAPHNLPRRKTVEMSMAWELDCVASGVVPLDNDHVLVLGLVPPCDDDEESDNFDSSAAMTTSSSGNDLELQIIAKEDGSILFSNILPMLRDDADQPVGNKRGVAQAESASDYSLLSTFALPRMDDALEAEMMDDEPMMDAFDLQVSLFSPSNRTKKRFVDPHLKWNLNETSFDDSAERNDTHGRQHHQHHRFDNDDDDDNNSVDSDDYGFIFRPLSMNDEEETAASSQRALATPPLMVIASRYDTVLASMRDIDDAVAHALRSGKSALALQRGLRQRRQLRKFDKNDLVDEYFCSLLRIPRHDENEEEEEEEEMEETHRNPLSLRRIKLAAKAMPVLFGGEIPLWERWVTEAEKIPGALFVLSDHLPVRDPKLPKEVYERVLETMLKEIYDMKATQDADDGKARKFTAKAEDMFLKVLTGWGPTTFLQEHIRHCKYDGRSKAVDHVVRDAEFRFARRFTQTSAGYLCFPVSRDETDATNTPPPIRSEGYFDSKRSLFDIDKLIEVVNLAGGDSPAPDGSTTLEVKNNARVALDAMSRLHMMKGEYDIALKCFISLGALHVGRPLLDFELGAVDFSESVGSRPVDKPWRSENGVPYTFLLDIIDNHHLQECLLDDHFLSSSPSTQVVPIFSLLQLVGFTFMGNFLIEHCVPPQRSERNTNDPTIGEERRGTLPLDLVAAQMNSNPRILHWYLRLVFTRKPEVYVRFPNTAYPPRAVTELHRIHFDLHLEFAGQERDSANALAGIEAYKVSTAETRLLQFLKKTLPLGGIRIVDAKKALENEREKDEDAFSTSFALELAYILEHYGEETESEAQRILDLYMKGAKSMVLAVSFAQRSTSYSSRLWRLLIEYCLEQESSKKDNQTGDVDGSLFGALLEAAALSGADLAKLVTQIPRGLAVEGLRPRLVAAVADYRLKLQMHEAAREGAKEEMISILRELSHRSRRGARYQLSYPPAPTSTSATGEEEQLTREENGALTMRLSKDLRTIERRDRHKLGAAPPIR